MKTTIITLTDDLFIGKGYHKKCYRHPHDPGLCIKMAYSNDGQKDLDREIKYLKVLKRKNKNYDILPAYYGPIETNLGTGHVYEFIQDINGGQCRTLTDYLQDPTLLNSNVSMLIEELQKLKTDLIENEIITMDIFPTNILVQWVGASNYRLRVINDMGSPALIPLEYYFSSIAKAKIIRHWNRFILHLERNYSDPAIISLIQAIK